MPSVAVQAGPVSLFITRGDASCHLEQSNSLFAITHRRLTILFSNIILACFRARLALATGITRLFDIIILTS